ncbi:hypothetical protein ZIOFF_002677 [Zingiber officinale]|uniref:Uncharacterized protein n=1 Tax=Zingiber officinale TaxID=94328 RepID=A0A8J5I7Z1_ZINOF|nr:hypothetical protein ZIOFF_002677 [Zingiber officinale]
MLIEGGRLVEKQTAMSSECSSGCQTGWTTYFLHSSDVRNSLSYRDGESFRGVEEEEEGLSMISDASSGPPHFNEDDGNGRFLYSALVPADGGKKKRTLVEQERNQHSSALDDTASSQLCNNPEVNSFTDCNYRMKKSMEETFFQSQEQALQAQSALKLQMGYSQCSACVKQNPTRPHIRGAAHVASGVTLAAYSPHTGKNSEASLLSSPRSHAGTDASSSTPRRCCRLLPLSPLHVAFGGTPSATPHARKSAPLSRTSPPTLPVVDACHLRCRTASLLSSSPLTASTAPAHHSPR